MAVPSAPSNLVAQTGNAQNYLTWDVSAGATSYAVTRSTNGVTYIAQATVSTNEYLDSTVAIGVIYTYQVRAVSTGGSSTLTTSDGVVPSITGIDPLGALRQQAKEKADRVNSNFVTKAEWNNYINQSYFELYDLLTTAYEDYFVSEFIFQITGNTNSYLLPNGLLTDVNSVVGRPMYKMLGVDLSVQADQQGWQTLRKYDFIKRNSYLYPNVTASIAGVFFAQYRVMGANIQFIPNPQAGQYVRLTYVPRMTRLLKDTDMADGVSGWTEYIIVDAAIKALMKEESDVSGLLASKQMLVDRIQAAASNRDAGAPDTISDTRRSGNTDDGSMF